MGAPAAQVLAERGHAVTLLDRYGDPERAGRLRLRSAVVPAVALRARGRAPGAARARALPRPAAAHRAHALHAPRHPPPGRRGGADVDAHSRPRTCPTATSTPPRRARSSRSSGRGPGQPAMFQPDGGVNHCVESPARLLRAGHRARRRGVPARARDHADPAARRAACACSPTAAASTPTSWSSRSAVGERAARADRPRPAAAARPRAGELLPRRVRRRHRPAEPDGANRRRRGGDVRADHAGHRLQARLRDRRPHAVLRDLRARPLDMALEQALVRRVRERLPRLPHRPDPDRVRRHHADARRPVRARPARRRRDRRRLHGPRLQVARPRSARRSPTSPRAARCRPTSSASERPAVADRRPRPQRPPAVEV